MALAAGRLRYKVEIQKPNTTQDPVTGEMVIVWQKIASVWAAVEPASVANFIAAAAAQSEVKGQIVIRKRDDITPAMRFVHRGKAYRILGLLDDKESGLEYTTCPVSEGVRVV
jgi:SPP1 family predicted phage head-tail adaptor